MLKNNINENLGFNQKNCLLLIKISGNFLTIITV